MFKIRTQRGKEALAERWIAIREGLVALGDVMEIEAAESIADEVPTRMLDPMVIGTVKNILAPRFDDVVEHLESQLP